jgi:hypothetical protein
LSSELGGPQYETLHGAPYVGEELDPGDSDVSKWGSVHDARQWISFEDLQDWHPKSMKDRY